MAKLSIAMITKNAQTKIEAALSSAAWADEIVIVDSYSSDKTRDITAKFTNKIFLREFDDFSTQKNFALSKCSHEWVFFLDSDEIISKELKEKIKQAIDFSGEYVYAVKRENKLFGKILRFAAGNDWPVRLFKKGCAKFAQPIHEYLKTDCQILKLNAVLIHDTIRDTKEDNAKTVLYTEYEAKWLLERGKKPTLIKLIFYPIITFLRIYLFKFGFLDGKPALMYAWYSARYSFIKYFKARKLIKNKTYLESIIAKRFNELSRQFPDSINPNDSRLNYLLKSLSPLKNKRILEIGCGKGRFSDQISLNHARCFGIDVSENFLQIAKNKNQGTFLKSSATNLPFKNNSFDAAFAVEVIEHIPGLEKLVIEANSALKPQGQLVIVDRNILSINNRRHFIPNFIIKKYHEMKNDWMYPKNFAYTEKWFLGPDVSKILKKYFNKVKTHYIISDSEKSSKTNFIFKIFPITRHFILWQASEPKKNYPPFKAPRDSSIIKEFSVLGKTFKERLSKNPKIFEHLKYLKDKPEGITNLYPQGGKNIFSLRIDADEAEIGDFEDYIEILKNYGNFTTIFCNCKAFEGKENFIIRSKELGIDIQSHAYHHHIYNDYTNNLINIKRAKLFFENLGIKTFGFAAPMGKYNKHLILALETLEYLYSSDFSYDYLNFPHYPKLGKRFSKVLEIPIFPVCPELLFDAKFSHDQVMDYFFQAIPKIKSANIPIIIYAHTSINFPQTKKFLTDLLKEISKDDSLFKMNVSDLAKWSISQKNNEFSQNTGLLNENFYKDFIKLPDQSLFGKSIKTNPKRKIIDSIKNFIDYETITPANELAGNKIKKQLKIIARNIRSINSLK